jgi:hypothetical protein
MSFLYPYWHARLYSDRDRIPPGTLEGYTAPLAKPGLFEHALSIVKTWTRRSARTGSDCAEAGERPTLLMWGEQRSRGVRFVGRSRWRNIFRIPS